MSVQCSMFPKWPKRYAGMWKCAYHWLKWEGMDLELNDSSLNSWYLSSSHTEFVLIASGMCVTHTFLIWIRWLGQKSTNQKTKCVSYEVCNFLKFSSCLYCHAVKLKWSLCGFIIFKNVINSIPFKYQAGTSPDAVISMEQYKHYKKKKKTFLLFLYFCFYIFWKVSFLNHSYTWKFCLLAYFYWLGWSKTKM